MPLNSTQLYVKGLLDGIALPGYTAPLVAYIQPPNTEPLGPPRAYVWGGRMNQKRRTMPRGLGFTSLNWTIQIWLRYSTNPNPNPENPLPLTLDSQFPLVVDAVLAALWSATIAVPITDPTTGVKSQMLAIGEEATLEYPPVAAVATQRTLLFDALINAVVKEDVQA